MTVRCLAPIPGAGPETTHQIAVTGVMDTGTMADGSPKTTGTSTTTGEQEIGITSGTTAETVSRDAA